MDGKKPWGILSPMIRLICFILLLFFVGFVDSAQNIIYAFLHYSSKLSEFEVPKCNPFHNLRIIKIYCMMVIMTPREWTNETWVVCWWPQQLVCPHLVMNWHVVSCLDRCMMVCVLVRLYVGSTKCFILSSFLTMSQSNTCGKRRQQKHTQMIWT